MPEIKTQDICCERTNAIINHLFIIGFNPLVRLYKW